MLLHRRQLITCAAAGAAAIALQARAQGAYPYKPITLVVPLAYGARAEINYVEGYPVVTNDADATRFAAEVAAELVGPENVDGAFPRLMGSEDFAYMLQARPGALVRLGNGPLVDANGLHNPRYDFHDANLATGAAFWSRLAERYLVDVA